MCIGVATGAAGCQGPDELIAQADRALYNAKQAGRNGTRVADEAPPALVPVPVPEKTPLRVIQGRP